MGRAGGRASRRDTAHRRGARPHRRGDRLARSPGAAWPFEENAGGAQTVRARDIADAFSQPAANLSFEQRMTLNLGNGLFEPPWVSAPA